MLYHRGVSRPARIGPVVVTGGAGFLGVNLVRALSAAGVSAHAVDLRPWRGPLPEGTRSTQADVCDAAAMAPIVEGAYAIVHAAAALPRAPESEIRRTGIEGVRTLLSLLERPGSTQRFVFLSTGAVYDARAPMPVTEDAPLSGMDAYGRAKVEAEAMCVAARAHGRVVTVLRPRTFVGPERLGIFSLLYRWASEGRDFPVLGSGMQRLQLLDVEDLCAAVLAALRAEPEAASDAFNVGNTVFGSVRDDFQAVLDAAGHGGRIVPILAQPAVPLLRAAYRAGVSPVYPWVIETFLRDSLADVSRIRDRLGFVPRYSNQQALLRGFAWYQAHAAELTTDDGTGHRTAWSDGALSVARPLFGVMPRLRRALR